MIKQLKPYPRYKDSSVPWLGQVPAHWRVRRLKFILREIDNSSESGTEQLLSVSQYTGVTKRFSSVESTKPNTRAKSLVGYKCVEPNDLVINIMLAWNGSLGVSNYSGIVSPAYCVYRFGKLAEPWYYHYLLRSPLYRDRIKAFSTGVVESRLRLYTENLYRLEAILPPPPEQTAIVRFLDWAERRIRKAIRLRQRRIQLLQEYKQALIHQAVTGQMDVRTGQPYPAYKNSGVEWLGKVPKHWQITRVKTEFDNYDHRRIPLSATERGAMKERIYDYFGASGVIDKVDNYLFDGEYLLLAEDGANLILRNLPLAIVATGKFWVNNHAHILKPKRGNIYFLAQLMESLNYLPWISGAAQPKLTQDRLMNITICIPPPEEQNHIMNILDKQIKPLTNIISADRRAIELLKELRTTLIAEVVTGKLDVREAAAQLPETPQSEAEDLEEIEEELPKPQEEKTLLQEEADD